jgi:hypothetical protein
MRRLLSFVARLGFTPREVRVIILLAVTLLAGQAVRQIPAIRRPPLPGTDGATPADADSEFFARAHAAFPDSAGPPGGRRKSPGPPVVDVNSATRDQLMLLPGIKGAYADRILDERSRRGGFRSVDDLLGVKGIGPKRLERLRPFVTAGTH